MARKGDGGNEEEEEKEKEAEVEGYDPGGRGSLEGTLGSLTSLVVRRSQECC